MKAIKVVFLGDSSVGKTCIINRFVFDRFDDQEPPSKSSIFITKNLNIPKLGKTIHFQIWDTAGQERYHSMAQMYYQDAQAAILVYDLNEPESFKSLKVWTDELKEKGPENIIKVIAGNKLDLIDDSNEENSTVNDFCKDIEAFPMIVSAKEDINIKKIFEHIALKVNKYVEPTKEESNLKLTGKSTNTKKKNCC